MTLNILNDKLFQEVASFAIAITLPSILSALKSHSAMASAQAAESTNNARAATLDRVKAYLYREAGNIAEREFPRLATRIQSGELNSVSAVHAQLIQLGANLHAQAIEQFKTQENIDIDKEFGTRLITSIIESAANSASPAPGMPTSTTLMNPAVTAVLASGGVQKCQDFVNDLVTNELIPVITTNAS